MDVVHSEIIRPHEYKLLSLCYFVSIYSSTFFSSDESSQFNVAYVGEYVCVGILYLDWWEPRQMMCLFFCWLFLKAIKNHFCHNASVSRSFRLALPTKQRERIPGNEQNDINRFFAEHIFYRMHKVFVWKHLCFRHSRIKSKCWNEFGIRRRLERQLIAGGGHEWIE